MPDATKTPGEPDPALTPDELLKPAGDTPLSATELDQVAGGTMAPPGYVKLKLHPE